MEEGHRFGGSDEGDFTCPILSIYYMPGALYTSSHLILPTSIKDFTSPILQMKNRKFREVT